VAQASAFDKERAALQAELDALKASTAQPSDKDAAHAAQLSALRQEKDAALAEQAAELKLEKEAALAKLQAELDALKGGGQPDHARVPIVADPHAIGDAQCS